MVIVWLIYSLSVAVLGSDEMTGYGSKYEYPGIEEQGPFYDLTMDTPDESGGRRLSDGRQPR